MPKIIQFETDEAKRKWGKDRLFSTDTWPGKNHVEIQLLADQVVDAFHQKVADAELNVQWIPRLPALNDKGGEGQPRREADDIEVLGEMLEEAYSEILSDTQL